MRTQLKEIGKILFIVAAISAAIAAPFLIALVAYPFMVPAIGLAASIAILSISAVLAGIVLHSGTVRFCCN